MRRVEQLAESLGVTAEHLRDPARMVEADEGFDDDEAALRQVGPRARQLHVRLELRDVVVGEVADDRLGASLRAGEIDDLRPGPDP